MDQAAPTVAQHAADATGAFGPHTAELTADIYALIVREIPQLHADGPVLTMLQASVAENVATVLHILQHGIDPDQVHAPAAAEQYARRLAQRGIPMTALRRAYRIGSTRFQHWCLQELARQTDDPAILSAAGLRIAETTAAYIDRVSEELVLAYEAEKEHWLRNLSAARAAASGPCSKVTRSTWMPPRPSWATGCASSTSAWCAGSATPRQTATRCCDWNRRP